jgi:hypothetical protein
MSKRQTWSGPSARILSATAVAVALIPLSLVTAVSVHAQTSATLPITESFTNADTGSNNWMLPSVPGAGTNPACLTVQGESDNTPIPVCSTFSAVDGLRLNDNTGGGPGGVAYGVPLSTAKPLDFTFNTWQYNANGDAGDGIAFFLAAVDPTAEGTALNLGQAGGSLGYAGQTPTATTRSPAVSTPGLPHAYLGVGLDVYGNFSDPSVSGAGCSDTSVFTPQAVVIRGPGDQGTGYCFLQNQQAAGSLDDPIYGQAATPDSARAAIATAAYPGVPVEVVVNPKNTVITTESGFEVPGRSLGVQYTPLNGDPQQMIQPLPGSAGGPVLPDGVIPTTWLDSTSGVPQQLMFGFSGATGSATEFHQISDLNVDAVSGPELRFTTQPLDTAVNQDMKNANNTTRHVKVTAYTAAGAVDTTFGTNVTLSFENAPSGAKFIVGGSPQTTMTATASAGVADFVPIKIDTAGFNYTLLAAAGSPYFDTISSPFTVAEAATSCTSNNTCQVTPPPGDDGSTANVQGTQGDIITATFGGGVAPILGCDTAGTTHTEILTVTGAKPKVVKLHIPPAFVPTKPRLKICFSSPKPFTVLGGTSTAQQNPANDNWYEGYLPTCRKFPNGPCIRWIAWSKTAGQTTAVFTGAADPHLMH